MRVGLVQGREDDVEEEASEAGVDSSRLVAG